MRKKRKRKEEEGKEDDWIICKHKVDFHYESNYNFLRVIGGLEEKLKIGKEIGEEGRKSEWAFYPPSVPFGASYDLYGYMMSLSLILAQPIGRR